MKEIRFSKHAQLKMEVLANHEITIDSDFVIETVRSPDKIEIGEEEKRIIQKRLNENLVLRVVYQEFNAFVLIITLYLVGGWLTDKSARGAFYRRGRFC